MDVKTTKDGGINFGLMFSKIDVENRTVSGFATLDNLDAHRDVVEADGSRKAFAQFRGGIREMHDATKAVGTLADFEPLKRYVEQDDKVYDGIYVSARVSKGAEDTWEKVLDGTYKGFSIGGKIREKVTKYDDDGNPYGIIKEYDLIELSLVDNPANPLATVMTVRKVGDSFVFNDDDVEKMNIFYHEESGDVVLSGDDERDGFQLIGWVDSPDDTAKIRESIQDFRRSAAGNPETDEATLLKNAGEDSITTNTDEGGATVATDIEKNDAVEEVEETEVTEEVTKAADVEENEELETEEVEKAADVSEVEESDETDFVAKVTDKVTEAIEAALAKATDAAKESKDTVNTVQTSFDEALKSFETKLSDLEKNLQDTLEGLTKRVADVESGTAVKKSADVVDDDSEEDGDENFWRGSGFLSVNDLTKG